MLTLWIFPFIIDDDNDVDDDVDDNKSTVVGFVDVEVVGCEIIWYVPCNCNLVFASQIGFVNITIITPALKPANKWSKLLREDVEAELDCDTEVEDDVFLFLYTCDFLDFNISFYTYNLYI